jgi:hypothetical protein
MRQKTAELSLQRFLPLFYHKHVRVVWECAIDNTKYSHTLYGTIVLVTIFKSAIRGGWMLRFALQVASTENFVQLFVADRLQDIKEDAHSSAFISIEHPELGLDTTYRYQAHILCIR